MARARADLMARGLSPELEEGFEFRGVCVRRTLSWTCGVPDGAHTHSLAHPRKLAHDHTRNKKRHTHTHTQKPKLTHVTC